MRLHSRMTTDTASLAIFDPAALEHRLHDRKTPRNVLIVALGTDGSYELEVNDSQPPGNSGVSALLICPSGRLFIGPGEEIPGGDCGPDTTLGGLFVHVPAAVVRVGCVRTSDGALAISVLPLPEHQGIVRNDFTNHRSSSDQHPQTRRSGNAPRTLAGNEGSPGVERDRVQVRARWASLRRRPAGGYTWHPDPPRSRVVTAAQGREYPGRALEAPLAASAFRFGGST